VLAGARACPHCGNKLGPGARKRLLTRGSWVFIAVVLAIFTLADTVSLLRERNLNEEVRRESRLATRFLTAYFSGDSDEVRSCTGGLEEFGEYLDHLAGKWNDCLPAEHVDDVRLWGARFYRYHRSEPPYEGRFRSCRRFRYKAKLYSRGHWYDVVGRVWVSTRRLDRVVDLSILRFKPLGDVLAPGTGRRHGALAAPEPSLAPVPQDG